MGSQSAESVEGEAAEGRGNPLFEERCVRGLLGKKALREIIIFVLGELSMFPC